MLVPFCRSLSLDEVSPDFMRLAGPNLQHLIFAYCLGVAEAVIVPGALRNLQRLHIHSRLPTGLWAELGVKSGL